MELSPLLTHLLFLFLVTASAPASALDFLINSFSGAAAANGTGILLVNDARLDATVVRLTNDSNEFSLGRVFYPEKTRMMTRKTTTTTTTNLTANVSQSSFTIASFSTSFVFSVLPEIATSPGFGLCFVLTNTTSPPGAFASQYFGLFTNATVPVAAPLLAVKFDMGRNTESGDQDGNHLGVNLNNIESADTHPAGYYNASGAFVPVPMRDGRNVRAWIDFDGDELRINVTVAPIGVPRPARPTLSYQSASMADYLSEEMFVGFSASKVTWVEAQRILAWSFSDTGAAAREINTTNLPVFLAPEASSSLSPAAIAGISVGCVTIVAAAIAAVVVFLQRRRREREEDDDVEDWEMEYWPHRFSYEELTAATDSFSADNLLGAGGFGKVYKGVLPSGTEIAVKCVNHDSKQGLREFMAEISSMGRLQHKNLVQMRGWCRKGIVLMLVYDFMPNGSLNQWIFDRPKRLLDWAGRRRVLADVAEGLSYLHHGYDQVVIHRDIKSSNILLDSDMRARLGDFGLAKLYGHGEVPNTTRVVGTLGYLAPELATTAAPTAASDVYSFGVVVLEVVCGRRPIEIRAAAEEEEVLVDWVRDLYAEGRVGEAADKRVRGECGDEEAEVVLKLGLACCHPDPLKRPSMREVVALLVGEGAAAAPADVLSMLARGESEVGGGGGAAVEEEVVVVEVVGGQN